MILVKEEKEAGEPPFFYPLSDLRHWTLQTAKRCLLSGYSSTIVSLPIHRSTYSFLVSSCCGLGIGIFFFFFRVIIRIGTYIVPVNKAESGVFSLLCHR